MIRTLRYSIACLLLTVTVAFLWAWHGVSIPATVEAAPFSCQNDAITHNKTSDTLPLKVLSFNVQYMAGKSYVFFYDADGGSDTQPSTESITLTTQKVADILRSEDADVVLLQEVNGSQDNRTHYRDQLSELMALLNKNTDKPLYPCQAETYYWQAKFIPHPKIMGGVDMKLITLSKHPITSATRHQLPLADGNFIAKQFYFYRAILETEILLPNKKTISILNTHFDAWGAGTKINQKQIAATQTRINELEKLKKPWILGGDFNILPPDDGRQREAILKTGVATYDKKSALSTFYKYYGAVPALQDLKSKNAEFWHTHFPNNPKVNAPDRTIDYVFYSAQWRLKNSYVRQQDTLTISDHLPIVGELFLTGHPDE